MNGFDYILIFFDRIYRIILSNLIFINRIHSDIH